MCIKTTKKQKLFGFGFFLFRSGGSYFYYLSRQLSFISGFKAVFVIKRIINKFIIVCYVNYTRLVADIFK